jgi:ABC-type sugar transport system ATPase subunit
MSGIQLNGIVKAYSAMQLVHGIDIEVGENEFVVLVGPPGCGKSTTLRMIADLEGISDGGLTIDGRVMNRVAPKDCNVAMIFQNYALYPHMNVTENMTSGLRICKQSKKNIEAAVEEIKRLHNRLGVTSIHVTHDQVEAMTLADRIVVKNDGRIEQIGSPMELFLNPANAFVAGFLGAPPMNQINAVIAEGNTSPVASFAGQELALPPLPGLQNAVGREVIVGVRPEYADVVTAPETGSISCELDQIETLGSEALLHMTLGGEPFVIRTETLGNMAKLDAVSGFTVQPDVIKVFDAHTGVALSGQARVA